MFTVNLHMETTNVEIILRERWMEFVKVICHLVCVMPLYSSHHMVSAYRPNTHEHLTAVQKSNYQHLFVVTIAIVFISNWH